MEHQNESVMSHSSCTGEIKINFIKFILKKKIFQIILQVNSSSDLMCLEASRLVVISTKFSHRPFVVENLENLDEDNENIHNNPEMNPRFTVKATVYDYWNTVN